MSKKEAGGCDRSCTPARRELSRATLLDELFQGAHELPARSCKTFSMMSFYPPRVGADDLQQPLITLGQLRRFLKQLLGDR